MNDLRYTGLVHSGSPHQAGPRLPFSVSAGKTTEVKGFIYRSGLRPQGGLKLTQPLGGSSSPPPPRYKGGLCGPLQRLKLTANAGPHNPTSPQQKTASVSQGRFIQSRQTVNVGSHHLSVDLKTQSQSISADCLQQRIKQLMLLSEQ